jgi:mRNA-degrading endonuclease YafQ of YafQ-DinJ toxin-antitoxin module
MLPLVLPSKKPLRGKLKDLWSFSIEFDLRVVFYFEEEKECVFIDIGTHEEVY